MVTTHNERRKRVEPQAEQQSDDAIFDEATLLAVLENQLAEPLKKNGYGQYLLSLLK